MSNGPNLDELLKYLEEQVNSAEKKQGKRPPRELDSCDGFIKYKRIVQGPDRVPNYVIYYTYRTQYSPKAGEESLSKVHFFRLFNRVFNQVRTGKQRYYQLDGESFDLSREGLLKAKKYDEEYKVEVQKANGTYKKPKRRYTKKHPKWGEVSVSKNG